MDKTSLLARAKDYIAKETDEGFKKDLQNLIADENYTELEDRLYRDLEFGTRGLRGIIGGGWNRMNTYVVRRASQGLASYVISKSPRKNLSAAIAYDSRHYSDVFALQTALVFAANGIKTYLFTSMRPTPELSFAIRHLGCDTGVVVTASHNPPQYNGYKVYWNDGAQVIPPHDKGIIAEVNATEEIQAISREEAVAKGLLVLIDKEVDEPYRNMVRSKLFRPDLIQKKAKEVSIVYSPLHGTGAMHVESILGELGLSIKTVPEQREGDGDFPTVNFPNPEEAEALKMALDLGTEEKADVVMATDPDADRLGIAVPHPQGHFALVTGNQLGSLLADYIFLSLKELNKMPAKPVMVNTIVTTGMQKRIAESYGASCLECLTGFKWIAAIMAEIESDNSGREFVFGTEESYGYLIEKEVRDKDAISAAALTAEMTLYWRSQGKSLLDRLDELYIQHGFWQELAISKYFQGSEGSATMKAIMANLREKPFKSLGGQEVLRVRDIQNSVSYAPLAKAQTETVAFPKSDVLQFFLSDGTIVSARPSGTEPKIKFYASSRTEVIDKNLDQARQASGEKLSAIEADIRALIGY